MKKIKDIINKWKLSWSFGQRNVAKATVLYYYIIIGGGVGIVYAIVSVFAGWPIIWAFSPVFGLLTYFVGLFVVKNWKLFWLYLRDIDQGRFLIRLNEATHFEESHKLRVVQWVYPRYNQVRNERWVSVANKIRERIALNDVEKEIYAMKKVGCPQQLIDGINQAILIDSLIYAHRNIRSLDAELRGIMNLTDENILAFDLQREVNKCRTKEGQKEVERLLNIGKKKSEQKRKNND